VKTPRILRAILARGSRAVTRLFNVGFESIASLRACACFCFVPDSGHTVASLQTNANGPTAFIAPFAHAQADVV
jgi:hypothetical protein